MAAQIGMGGGAVQRWKRKVHQALPHRVTPAFAGVVAGSGHVLFFPGRVGFVEMMLQRAVGPYSSSSPGGGP